MNESTDGEIVTQVLAGDTEAYRILFRRYGDRYMRFAVRMLGNREDADEALQDAFLRAYRALPQCEDPDRFGAWLYQILMNQCRTKGTRRGRRDRYFVHDEDALAQAPSDVTPDAGVGDEIDRALAQLDETYREAFILKHVQELSYEEMAEITGDGVSALKMRVKRACDRMRVLLEGVADV